MKHKSLKATILTTVLALSMAPMAMADPTPPGPPVNTDQNSEFNKNKDTTISIVTSSLPDFNISYTVPLYVTVAVASKNPTVKVPENYDFINTTPKVDINGTPTSVNVGITSLTFEKLKGTGADQYYTTANTTPTDAKDIYLTIGGEPMPAITAQNVTDGKNVKTWVPVSTTFTKTAAQGQTPAVPQKIESDATLHLPITGTVANVDRTDSATAAQFRIKYTVSVLGQGDATLGSVYAGSDRVAAGLEAWPTSN